MKLGGAAPTRPMQGMVTLSRMQGERRATAQIRNFYVFGRWSTGPPPFRGWVDPIQQDAALQFHYAAYLNELTNFITTH